MSGRSPSSGNASGEQTPPENPREGILEFDSAGEGLKRLREDFHYWTERRTTLCLQLWLALIGANWAVFKSVDRLFGNVWAVASIGIATLGVGIDLWHAHRMGELHRKAIDAANAKPDVWQDRWRRGWGDSNEKWPFTNEIEWTGKWFGSVRFYATLIGWGLFFLALGCPWTR